MAGTAPRLRARSSSTPSSPPTPPRSRLWQSLGFEIVGTVPDAFRLPDDGAHESYADLHVMYLRVKDSR